MGRTACTEPQCLYKGVLYLYFTSYTGVCIYFSKRSTEYTSQSRQAPFHQALYLTASWQGSYRNCQLSHSVEDFIPFAPWIHKFTQLKTSRLEKDNRKKLPHWRHTNCRRHRTIFSRLGYVHPWFAASLGIGRVKSLRRQSQARFERTLRHFRHFLGVGLSRELRGQTSSWAHKIIRVV